MSISRVQTTFTSGHNNAPSLAYTSSVTAGNHLIALIAYQGSATTITGPSGWSLATSTTNTNGTPIYLYYRENAPGGSTTVTASLTGVTGWTVYVAEYSGVATSSSSDGTATGTSASGAAPSGTVTTANAVDLVIAGLCETGTSAFSSPTGGFTLVNSSTTGFGTAFLELITSSSGTYSTSANNTGGGNGVVAAYKSNGAAAVTSPAAFLMSM